MTMALQAMAPVSSNWHTAQRKRGRASVARQNEPALLPTPEADEEHGENDGERVNRPTEQQREQTCPDHFGPSAVMPESAMAR